jgi:hypothetical protein
MLGRWLKATGLALDYQEAPVQVKTDYMKIKVIKQFVDSLDECMEILRAEASNGNLYSGLQADVIEPISNKLKHILSGQEGR